jgi:mRNA interferase HicA
MVLAFRSFSSDTADMKGSEFVRKVRALAHQRGIAVVVDASRGKGSHQTLYFGNQFTIVRNLKDEL